MDEIDKRNNNIEERTDKVENKIEDILKALVLIQADYYSGYLTWRIPEVSKLTKHDVLHSPPFYTKRDGYKMCLIVNLNGDCAKKISIKFAMMRGEYDPLLKWPFMAKVTITLLSQDKNTAYKDIVRSFIPDPNSDCFQMPTTFMNDAAGFRFISRSILSNSKAGYIKDDVMFIKAAVDISMITSP